MMHVIIGEGLHDADYVAQHTIGFEQLQEKVKNIRRNEWRSGPAFPPTTFESWPANMRPAAGGDSRELWRAAFQGGGMATRAITMLPCITGSWKEVGGGLQLSLSGAWGLKSAALERPDLMQKRLGARRASSTWWNWERH